ASNPSADFSTATSRFRDAAQNFQQGTLAGPIPPDDADDLALANFEVNVFQGPERFLPSIGPLSARQAQERCSQRVRTGLARCLATRSAAADDILLGQVLDPNYGRPMWVHCLRNWH